jgi:environmental stress-induced protein Ves
MPWKNGLGTTRELWKETDAAGETLLRVSIAEVRGNQPFSNFAGFERLIMQLDGPGMSLEVDGKTQALQELVPFAFRGESAVRSIISGEGTALDLNLMAARRCYRPAMRIVRETEELGATPDTKNTRRLCLALVPFRLSDPSQTPINTHDMVVPEKGELVQWPDGQAMVLLEAERI